MGGNSPSHLSRDDGDGGGVTFVKGIRLSDKVIHRMKQSSKVVRPQLSHNGAPPSRSPETPTPTPPSAPSVEDMLPPLTTPPALLTPPPPAAPREAPSPAPSVEPAPPPVKLVPPPPDEVPAVASVPPPAKALEEELRQKIREEMQTSLEEEINQKRQELQQQLEEIRAQCQAEAGAAAQAQVEQQVKETLEAEKAAYRENLTDSIMKERMKTEDERLMVQLYAYQLEEREKELKKRDALYKEHVAKLETKCTDFYKVTAESFQQGKEDAHNRFARFSVQPVCGDLQSQILKCYKENTGKTLSCSGIASAYMQCVDNAKKDKLSTGG
ncbi:putative proline-rich extensin-like protein EPR1 [Scophthalmus maximus]|uniref:Putative proline-rich extensin-like protein EPR1 n=1 Tax=Scophthalmus maximus TaxID=52904 RepID=A0A2U9BXR1_SCOMX|nr:putative proline-rich extensin-like protein EPR1 [Scophthalmus maximus]